VGLRDAMWAVPILGAALYVLYRSTFRSGGHCAGCSGACEAPPRKAGTLVTLGRPPREPGRGNTEAQKA
jgi:hypothetical protein